MRPDDPAAELRYHPPARPHDSRPRYHQKDTMTPRRSSRPTLPRLALSAAVLALTAAATAVIAPQTASAADALPAGSTLVLSVMAQSTPGLAQAIARATLTAPDDSVDTDPNTPACRATRTPTGTPLADQDVTLSVDHGFFTTGSGGVPSVVGATAGNLAKLGTTITEKTNSQGELVVPASASSATPASTTTATSPPWSRPQPVRSSSRTERRVELGEPPERLGRGRPVADGAPGEPGRAGGVG